MGFIGRKSNGPRKEVSDLWDSRYEREGHMWGDDPSPTLQYTRAAIDKYYKKEQKLYLIDFGCGYGRDTVTFAEMGHHVTGIDASRQAVRLANENFEARKGRGHLPGSANFLFGTITTALKNNVGQFDAIHSHRALHLLDEKEVSKFAEEAAKRLRPGGILCIGARSPKDFKPDQMRWLKGQEGHAAEYKNPERRDQVLNFWYQARFEATFRKDFVIEQIVECEESESEGNPVPTQLTIMVARRKGAPHPGGA
jgi:SAM-dependent methyltransferase